MDIGWLSISLRGVISHFFITKGSFIQPILQLHVNFIPVLKHILHQTDLFLLSCCPWGGQATTSIVGVLHHAFDPPAYTRPDSQSASCPTHH